MVRQRRVERRVEEVMQMIEHLPDDLHDELMSISQEWFEKTRGYAKGEIDWSHNDHIYAAALRQEMKEFAKEIVLQEQQTGEEFTSDTIAMGCAMVIRSAMPKETKIVKQKSKSTARAGGSSVSVDQAYNAIVELMDESVAGKRKELTFPSQDARADFIITTRKGDSYDSTLIDLAAQALPHSKHNSFLQLRDNAYERLAKELAREQADLSKLDAEKTFDTLAQYIANFKQTTQALYTEKSNGVQHGLQ